MKKVFFKIVISELRFFEVEQLDTHLEIWKLVEYLDLLLESPGGEEGFHTVTLTSTKSERFLLENTEIKSLINAWSSRLLVIPV